MASLNGVAMRTIRKLTKKHIPRVVDYFLEASPEFLKAMGIVLKKRPSRETWYTIILNDLDKPLEQRDFFYVIWEINGFPIGHSNIDKIKSGEEAYLHLWHTDERNQGNGLYFIRESLKHYFEAFQLKTLYCEPCAENPAPNKTLEKAGFSFIKQYETTPGWLNFHQTVNRWELSKENFKKIKFNVL